MPPIEFLALVGLVGLCVGSFLNVVIHRTPRRQSPWSPSRSYCPSCLKPLRASDNIPLVSYLRLRGKCRECGVAISVRYPLVEVAAGILFVVTFARWGWTLRTVEGMVFASLLLALTVIDLETYRLPNVLIAVGVGFALAFGAADGSVEAYGHRIIAGMTGFFLLYLVRLIGTRVARREAMGFGDVKFLGMIGLFFDDWHLIPLTVGLSALAGSIVGVWVIFLRRGRAGTAIPYGPFLALAAWVVYQWGDALLAWYLRR